MQITRTRIKISTFGNVRGYAFHVPSEVASARNYARMSIVGEAGESSRTVQVIEIRRYASWTSTNERKNVRGNNKNPSLVTISRDRNKNLRNFRN